MGRLNPSVLKAKTVPGNAVMATSATAPAPASALRFFISASSLLELLHGGRHGVAELADLLVVLDRRTLALAEDGRLATEPPLHVVDLDEARQITHVLAERRGDLRVARQEDDHVAPRFGELGLGRDGGGVGGAVVEHSTETVELELVAALAVPERIDHAHLDARQHGLTVPRCAYSTALEDRDVRDPAFVAEQLQLAQEIAR